MLLPKEDKVNTRIQVLGFENQNDDVNPRLLNKAMELAPCLYNIDEMGKDLLSDHKIISKEELKCEAEKCLKVKQRKSSLLYHGFVYESGEKNGNEKSWFKTKIKELKMILAQQTKDFEDAKVDFSKKTDKFETYFEKLKKIRVVLERQLDRKTQDSKAEKDQFLNQIASLESKLASQGLILNQKEYSELRISYNALKAKFDALNRDKGKSPISNLSTPKVSVSNKIYTGESSKSFQKKVSQFTTYSLQKDREFSKKPHVFETPISQKAFKSSDLSKKKHIFETPKSPSTPVRKV
ncbi:hypothetical protein Tco_1346831 [Tanacetum coccineum]